MALKKPRNRISWSRDCDAPARAEPNRNIAMADQEHAPCRPNCSESLPTTGTTAVLTSRYTVVTQV